MWAVITDVSKSSSYWHQREALRGAVVNILHVFRDDAFKSCDGIPTLRVRFHQLWLEMHKASIPMSVYRVFHRHDDVFIMAKYKPIIMDEGGNDNE